MSTGDQEQGWLFDLESTPESVPAAHELLEAVREFLVDRAAPALDGQLAFHARVAANVVRVVEREFEHRVEHASRRSERLARWGVADEQELALAIRDGRLHVDDIDLRSDLREAVRDRLTVADPRHLTS